LGTISIEYRRFGTQIDFVPIVHRGNSIRLEVRPRISEIDDTRSVTINGQQVPGLRVREADVRPSRFVPARLSRSPGSCKPA
jgi:pilus assembly protein CpaC